MNFEPMKNFMDRLVEWRVPGNSISICVDGKEVFSYQSGYADVEKQIPMREDHLFNIYSCSKVATVVAAMQLYEKGYFLLDDPLYEYIPEYREMYVKRNEELVKAKNPITLRHLFTMTSGLSYKKKRAVFDEAAEMTDGKMDTLTVVKCLDKDHLKFEPGEKWLYSLSHDVLAAVVEVISGKKFRDYMTENVWEPLGMTETTYHNDSVRGKMAEQYRYEETAETDLVKLQALGHTTNNGRVVNVGKDNEFVFGTEYDSGGAGITTSVRDYTKFVSALAGGGKGATGEQIISKGTLDLIRQNQLSEELLKYLNWKQLKGYGYGLGVRTLMDKAVSGSNGSLQEFGWGGAAGATVLVDMDRNVSLFYAQHMLNPNEGYYQPRLRNVFYSCLD